MTATDAAWRRLKNGTLIVQFCQRRPWVRVYSTRKARKGESVGRPTPLAVTPNAKGYPRVEIIYRKRKYTVLLHRLVWMARHARPLDNGDEVDHDDGDKLNYRPDNLVRVSAGVNMAKRNEQNEYWGGKQLHELDEAELDAYEAEKVAAFLYG